MVYQGMVKDCNDVFSRFDTIPDSDRRQTDKTPTDSIERVTRKLCCRKETRGAADYLTRHYSTWNFGATPL